MNENSKLSLNIKTTKCLLQPPSKCQTLTCRDQECLKQLTAIDHSHSGSPHETPAHFCKLQQFFFCFFFCRQKKKNVHVLQVYLAGQQYFSNLQTLRHLIIYSILVLMFAFRTDLIAAACPRPEARGLKVVNNDSM